MSVDTLEVRIHRFLRQSAPHHREREWHRLLAEATLKLRDANILAAAIDVSIRRNALDPRSEIADCRLDYGEPFTPEAAACHLLERRHGKNRAGGG